MSDAYGQGTFEIIIIGKAYQILEEISKKCFGIDNNVSQSGSLELDLVINPMMESWLIESGE